MAKISICNDLPQHFSRDYRFELNFLHECAINGAKALVKSHIQPSFPFRNKILSMLLYESSFGIQSVQSPPPLYPLCPRISHLRTRRKFPSSPPPTSDDHGHEYQ